MDPKNRCINCISSSSIVGIQDAEIKDKQWFYWTKLNNVQSKEIKQDLIFRGISKLLLSDQTNF